MKTHIHCEEGGYNIEKMCMSMIRDYKMINNVNYQYKKRKEVADKMKLDCKTWLNEEFKSAAKWITTVEINYKMTN